jgi:hypothetical protein
MPGAVRGHPLEGLEQPLKFGRWHDRPAVLD